MTSGNNTGLAASCGQPWRVLGCGALVMVLWLWCLGGGLFGGGSFGLGGEVLSEPGPDPLAAVHGGFWLVGGAVHREERVSGALIGVELVGLALRLEFLLKLGYLV